MTERERQALVREATTAWRARDLEGRVLPHPAWADLEPAARLAVYEETAALRAIEAALDVRGLSTTARAVLARLGRG